MGIQKKRQATSPVYQTYVRFCNTDSQRCERLVRHNTAGKNHPQYAAPVSCRNQSRQENSKRIITAGRLVEQKGYDLLLDAWSKVHQKHPEWILDIYGEGEDKTMLLEKRKNLALENSVLFHPPTLDIYQKYMDSDFYVMSSRFEGFGLVLAEAMSCGIPCVSFDCPHGPSDIIKDYEDGLLVEKENIKELADKICYLIENENVRIKMGHKARENVKRFLPENVMPQWKNLFESLTYSSK